MIKFSKYDNLHIQIHGGDREYIRAVEEKLTDYVKGYAFMPAYKSGKWNGKVCLFKRGLCTFPYGLLTDVLRMTKKDFSDYEYTVDEGIKDFFRGIDVVDEEYNLCFKPYQYQKECIESILKTSRGIMIVATAGGKSLIIAYIIQKIQSMISTPALIIVPTIQLVDQFKGDLIEYGFDEKQIGKVNAKYKEFNRSIVISTWQSLQHQMNELHRFGTVIVDECHSSKATKLMEILGNIDNAKFRIGVTGTMPNNHLDDMNVRSYIGPVIKTFRGRDLADLGYISKCTVKQVHIEYQTDIIGDYQEIRDIIFNNPYRLGLIAYIVENTNNSILILVDKVKKEGCVLEEYLKENFPNKRIVFLSGKDKSEDRDEWRKEINDNDDIICIATYPIFQAGVNIKSLRTIILASPTKSYIRVIQSLGRALRKHVTKDVGGAELWDIVDDVKYLSDHGEKRNRHYTKERHDILEFDLKEKDGVYCL